MAPIQRILLVDDNESDNFYHGIILQRSGFTGELQCFDNGKTALQYLQQADLSLPCLILLDINMPEMDGFAFARAATPLLQDTAAHIVLMLSPMAAEQDRQKALKIPVIRHFATKPLTTEQITTLLTGA